MHGEGLAPRHEHARGGWHWLGVHEIFQRLRAKASTKRNRAAGDLVCGAWPDLVLACGQHRLAQVHSVREGVDASPADKTDTDPQVPVLIREQGLNNPPHVAPLSHYPAGIRVPRLQGDAQRGQEVVLSRLATHGRAVTDLHQARFDLWYRKVVDLTAPRCGITYNYVVKCCGKDLLLDALDAKPDLEFSGLGIFRPAHRSEIQHDSRAREVRQFDRLERFVTNAAILNIEGLCHDISWNRHLAGLYPHDDHVCHDTLCGADRSANELPGRCLAQNGRQTA
mmetsp:Transcript_6510/g.19337  ORF Transcript_6510/g.19337 Transcript_6510/m.19337 type:complete len:281 (-) Transcript_6510:37-879(-)